MYDLGSQFHIDKDKLLAKKEAIFQGKRYRITILSERLIRLEYQKDGQFNDMATQLVINRDFDLPAFEVKEDVSFIEIKTKNFKLTYAKEQEFKGTALNTMKNLSVHIEGSGNIWYYGHPEVRNFHGSNVSLENFDKPNKTNNGLYSVEGFVSIDDSQNLRLDSNGTIINETRDGVDLYVFAYGKDFGFCVGDYFKLTGMPSLVPRYVLGNWWCRDLPYTSEEILEITKNFLKHDMYLSVFLLSDNWHIKETDKVKDAKTGFTFNNKLIADPAKLIEDLHSAGIRLGLSVNPKEGIKEHEIFYEEFKKYVAPGEDGTIAFNPRDPRFLDVYLKVMLHPLENMGVDFFWNDYDEIKDLKNLWILNHYQYNDLARNQGKRGMILARNSMIAAHRYPVLYSGQTQVSWSNFKLLPFFNLSASNIGVSWWSHDVGGHHGGIEDPELYIRSVQLGTFSPIMRFHSSGGKYYKREPWRWDHRTREIVNNYLKQRHELTSYLYTEAYKYHKFGKVIFQPLYYVFPKAYDDDLYRNEYFFGSELFVTPIVNKKEPIMDRTIHRFYLPEGTWYDFYTGKKYLGNKKYITFYKEEDYPVFAKKGSIIPLSLKSNTNNTSNPSELEIQVFPGQNNTYNLYEDDGISSLYKEGYYLLTQIDYNYLPNNYTLIIRALEGKSGIVPDKRSYKIRFRNTKYSEEVKTYYKTEEIPNNSYVDNNDFVVEVNDVSTIGQLTINCKGNDIEIDAARVMNEDIDEIIKDLMIPTLIKESIAEIIFGPLELSEKRIALRKLKKQGLDQSFIKLFLKLLEYASQV